MRQTFFAMLFTCALGSPLAWAQSPTAIVGSVSGPARTLTPPTGGSKLTEAKRGAVKTLAVLNSGMFVQLGEGSKAVLFFYSDGHQESLQGPCLIRLGAAGGHLVKGDSKALQVKESELGEALRPPDNEATRMDVGNGTTLKLSTQAQQTVFSWQTQQAGPYLITVTDSTRQANIWSSELAGNSVTYTGPELLPDNPYVWQLQAGSEALGAMRFEAPSHGSAVSLGQAKAEVKVEDPATLAAWSVIQDQRGNLPEAVAAAKAALQKQPQDAALMQRLSVMLTEMGEKAQAESYSAQLGLFEDNGFPEWGAGMDPYLSTLNTVYYY